MAQQGKQYVKFDRFQQKYQVISAYKNEAGFYKGYVTLKGKLYCIEFGEQDRTKDKGKREGQEFRWVRVTESNRQNAASATM